jgi:hypothetical protein
MILVQIAVFFRRKEEDLFRGGQKINKEHGEISDLPSETVLSPAIAADDG